MPELEDILATGKLVRGCAALQAPAADWSLERLLGEVTELSGRRSGVLSLAAGLIWQAQRRREVCAWVTDTDELAYPPDLAAAGVDLACLAVLRLPAPLDAAERLLRSGGFGLILVDCALRRLPPPVLQRVTVQARRQRTALVFLTRKQAGEGSLGSLVGLHLQVTRQPQGDGYVCQAQARKDKRQAPFWQVEERCDGPPGLC